MKKKIVLIIFLPKFLISGAGNSVFKLIQGLNKKKFIMYVICFGKCEYSKKFSKTVKLFELNYNRLVTAFFKIHEIVKNIENKHKREKLIFLSNHHYVNIFALTIKMYFKRIKIIGVERTAIHELNIFYSIKDFFKKKILLFCVKKFYKYLDKIVSNSNDVKNEINKFSNRNSITIYPPSFEKPYPKKKSKSNLEKKINILMIGRLDSEKGINVAIKAITLLKQRVCLTIVGRGSNYQKNILLRDKSNKDVIKFVGHKNNLKKYYLNADLFLNTSHFEGFSNALIDSLNYEVPVIASKCPGGNKEILKAGKFGQLFFTNDHVNLSKMINNFIVNRKIYIQKTLLGKKSLKRFYISKNINNYTKLFEKI